MSQASDFGSIGFGLASGAAFGAGDFCGGMAGKRAPLYGVILCSQVVGLLLLIVCAIAFNQPIPPAIDLIGGAISGIGGTIGLFALYYSLAHGKMSVAAPVSGAVAVMVPLLFAALIREQIKETRWLGFAVALAAVWFVSRSEGGAIRLRDVLIPAIAGASFGLFYIISNRVTSVSYFWPLVAARVTSLIIFFIIATVRGEPRIVPRATLRLTSLGGLLDAAGNALYVISSQIGGQIAIAAVLASLYPAMTVTLARVVLKEKIRPLQGVGIVLTLIAITLISL